MVFQIEIGHEINCAAANYATSLLLAGTIIAGSYNHSTALTAKLE